MWFKYSIQKAKKDQSKTKAEGSNKNKKKLE